MSTRERVTIADVARAAGVSPGTVSRVINRRDTRISAATQKQVLDAAEKLGYQANPFASALRKQQVGVIGAVVRDVSDPFLSLMARELQRHAHLHGVELLMGHAENDLQIVRRQIKFMRNWFDGLLIVGDMSGYEDVLSELEESGTPFVAVACGPESSAPLVNIDENQGMRLAVEYLSGLGHKRIGFLGNTQHAGTQARLNAFCQLIEEHALTWNDDYLQPTPYTRPGAIASVQRLLGLPQPPTAVVCTSDLQALGAMAGAWQIGWRVPEALSILGFDDIEEGRYTYPALTTIRQPVGDMAENAMRLLMQLIQGDTTIAKDTRVLITPELIVRRSCTRAVA
jgi:DNA-binding LacI/PurR family transcriptional regulator